VGNEQTQPIYGVLNTTQTDSAPVAVEEPKDAADIDNPEAPRHPPVADRPLGGVTSAEAQASVEASSALPTEQKKEEPKQEEPKPTSQPNVGEKRDIDSTTTLIAAPASEDKDKTAIEKPDESTAKKQKTEPEPVSEPAGVPVKDTNGTAPAPATGDTNGEPKKTARPKKEKVKDAVKKVIPTDGIGSRTRSRTKPT
jgi:hypothetical protein